jgi:hypothetical protein
LTVGVGHVFAATWFASWTPWSTGLGECVRSWAVGVPHNEDPVPEMRRAKVGRLQACPFTVIPVRGQRPENGIQPPSKQRCDVLQKDVSRSKNANHSHEFVEEARPLSAEAGSESGVRHILAGETTSDDIDIPSINPCGFGSSLLAYCGSLWTP